MILENVFHNKKEYFFDCMEFGEVFLSESVDSNFSNLEFSIKIPEYQNLVEMALGKAVMQWDSPEFIPLLCTLYPRLLVQCAEAPPATAASSLRRRATASCGR